MFSLFQINVLRNRVSDHQKTWETNSQSHFSSFWCHVSHPDAPPSWSQTMFHNKNHGLSNRLNHVKGLGLQDKKEKTETDEKRIVTINSAEIQISSLLILSSWPRVLVLYQGLLLRLFRLLTWPHSHSRLPWLLDTCVTSLTKQLFPPVEWDGLREKENNA